MSQPALFSRASGVATTTSLRPLDDACVPVLSPQAALPLDLDTGGLPRRPDLRLVQGAEDGLSVFAARLSQAVVDVNDPKNLA